MAALVCPTRSLLLGYWIIQTSEPTRHTLLYSTYCTPPGVAGGYIHQQFANFVREMFTDVQLPVRQGGEWGRGEARIPPAAPTPLTLSYTLLYIYTVHELCSRTIGEYRLGLYATYERHLAAYSSLKTLSHLVEGILQFSLVPILPCCGIWWPRVPHLSVHRPHTRFYSVFPFKGTLARGFPLRFFFHRKVLPGRWESISLNFNFLESSLSCSTLNVHQDSLQRPVSEAAASTTALIQTKNLETLLSTVKGTLLFQIYIMSM